MSEQNPTSPLQHATEEMQSTFLKVKPEVMKEVGMDFSIFQLVTFKETFVNLENRNFMSKIFIGGDNHCIHVDFTVLYGTEFGPATSVNKVETGKTFFDPL